MIEQVKPIGFPIPLEQVYYMKKTWILVLAFLALGVVGRWFATRPSDSPDVQIPTTQIQRGVLSKTVTATGVVRPVVGAEINVGSRVSGTVLKLMVKVGDPVEAGDLLAQIDPALFKARADQARAELSGSKAQLSLAELSVKRIRDLLEQGFGAQEDLDKAIRDLEMAKSNVQLNKARLESAEIDLGHTAIYAPIKGVIADVTTREGETVAASFSAPTFVTIIDLDRMEIRAFVDETDIGRISKGQTALFNVDAWPEVDIPARAVAIQPKAELQGNVVNYVVILAFSAPPNVILRPEMTTHIRFSLEKRDNVVVAPRNVVRQKDGRSYVIVKKASSWTEQEVKVGLRTHSGAEILEGLQGGEIVRVN